jgi:putative ABC transport system substrate-binding protein
MMPTMSEGTARLPDHAIISELAAPEAAATLAAFRKGIRDLGYVEGQTIVLDFRLSKGDHNAFPELVLQLIRIPVDVIVTDSTSATEAAASATHTIPIVMAASGGDPVALGFAASLNKPGGNVTGMSLFSLELNAKRLQLLKYAFPAIRRIAVLVNPTSAIGPTGLRDTQEAAKLLGVAVNPIEVGNPGELRALQAATLVGSDGLIVTADAMFWNYRTIIIALASSARAAQDTARRWNAANGIATAVALARPRRRRCPNQPAQHLHDCCG